MFSWFLNFMAIIALAITQISFWSALPFFQTLNFVLLFIIYLSIKISGRALPFAIIGGYILDVFSSYPFGLHILAAILTTLAATYVYSRILTNYRFLPIIILTAASIIFYHSILILSVSTMSFLKLTPKMKITGELFIKNLSGEIIYTVVGGSLLYLIHYLAKKKISSRFFYAAK